MPRNTHLILLALLLLAPAALATTFVVPTDDELIAKSEAIVIGTVEGHWVDTSRELETVYEVRIERAIKGFEQRERLLRVFSPGGELPDGGVIVHGAPHFAEGERVLLFLVRHNGRWETTDLTLGKFKFETSTKGVRVLVRDAENIVGWDRSGGVHVERVRTEGSFLRFVEEKVRGGKAQADYFVAPGSIVLESASPERSLQPNAPAFPAYTYTDNVQLPNGGPYVGTRFENVAAGVTVYKRSETSIAGAADGGVSVIQNALASWNNECGSVINLIYGGLRANTPSLNQDGISVVEFNDPQNRIAGSWTGSGIVARTFLSYWNPHEWPTGSKQTWWSIKDFDVVFQDGYTAANASFPTAMTHEVGHGLGWRHSDAHYIRPTGNDEPCQAGVEECSSNAIMYHSSISSLGYTLQTWDQNAAQAVYPGGSCGAVRQKTPSDFNGDGVSDMVIYRNGEWLAFNQTSGAFLWSVTTPSYPGGIPLPMDYDGDGRTDFSTYRPGAAWHFFTANGSYLKGIWIGGAGDIPVPADYDGDGKEDVVVYRNGTWIAYDFNTGGVKWSVTTGAVAGGIPLPMDYDGDGRSDFTC
jgi:hypothetical protein